MSHYQLFALGSCKAFSFRSGMGRRSFSEKAIVILKYRLDKAMIHVIGNDLEHFFNGRPTIIKDDPEILE